MMNETVTLLRVTMESPDRSRTHQVVEALRAAGDVAVSILRGCITKREAWFDVELRGPEGRVRETVRRTRDAGVIISGGAA